jgi:hypothetical protein
LQKPWASLGAFRIARRADGRSIRLAGCRGQVATIRRLENGTTSREETAMTKPNSIAALVVLCALPALAQTTTAQQEPGTTTTVQQQPGTTVQQQPGTTTTVQSSPGSTTVQTQPQQPQPGTQVVVNPPPAEAPPATTTRVKTYDTPVIEEHHRPAMATIAIDALYGGAAGALVGGGIALITDGDHWQRDLMIGAGVGILSGVGIGIVQAASDASDSTRVRAAADQIRPEGAHAPGGPALAMTGRW